jgi:hypothetical protein
MPMPSGFQAQEQEQAREQAQHDHRHARDTARSRAEHLLRALARAKCRQTPGKMGAIVRNELVASPGIAPFDGAERDFPGNRSPARWKFICRPKRKIYAPGEGRFQRRPRRSPLLSKATAL